MLRSNDHSLRIPAPGSIQANLRALVAGSLIAVAGALYPVSSVLGALCAVGAIMSCMWIAMFPAQNDIVVTRGSFVREGMFGGPLATAGGLRIQGAVGESCALYLGDLLLQGFDVARDSDPWLAASRMGAVVAEVSGLLLVDERFGDHARWLAADPEGRALLRMEAQVERGLNGHLVVAVPPAVIEGDHDELVVRIGGKVFRSSRRSFAVASTEVGVREGMRVRVVSQRIGPSRWLSAIWCVMGKSTVTTEPVSVDDRGLAELTWFAEHLEATARKPADVGNAADVPVGLQALRRPQRNRA